MLRVAAFDLGKGKDKYCTGYGPVPSRLPFISTRFHDKMIKLLKRRIIRYITSRVFFFLFFFCKRFFVCFQDSFNTTKPFHL